MPVRVYDIALKLGLESKEVILKARQLGISAAKVPSSSLDKVTAEYLIEQLGGSNRKQDTSFAATTSLSAAKTALSPPAEVVKPHVVGSWLSRVRPVEN